MYAPNSGLGPLHEFRVDSGVQGEAISWLQTPSSYVYDGKF